MSETNNRPPAATGGPVNRLSAAPGGSAVGLSDADLVAGVIAGDEAAVRCFFFQRFDAMLRVLAAKAYGPKSYCIDDCIQELFIFLSADDYRRLRTYDTSLPLAPWLSVTAYRFFRDCAKKQIDFVSLEPIYNKQESLPADVDSEDPHSTLIMDLTTALSSMSSRRDADILRALLLDQEEPAAVAKAHNITVANLYNIKRRALARLTTTYLRDYAVERGCL